MGRSASLKCHPLCPRRMLTCRARYRPSKIKPACLSLFRFCRGCRELSAIRSSLNTLAWILVRFMIAVLISNIGCGMNPNGSRLLLSDCVTLWGRASSPLSTSSEQKQLAPICGRQLVSVGAEWGAITALPTRSVRLRTQWRRVRRAAVYTAEAVFLHMTSIFVVTPHCSVGSNGRLTLR